MRGACAFPKADDAICGAGIREVALALAADNFDAKRAGLGAEAASDSSACSSQHTCDAESSGIRPRSTSDAKGFAKNPDHILICHKRETMIGALGGILA